MDAVEEQNGQEITQGIEWVEILEYAVHSRKLLGSYICCRTMGPPKAGLLVGKCLWFWC
jgi:hypothetical protein